jgi:hypothetical protein
MFSGYLEFLTVDKVYKASASECYMLPSEPSTFCNKMPVLYCAVQQAVCKFN